MVNTHKKGCTATFFSHTNPKQHPQNKNLLDSSKSALTQVKDAIPGPVPAPAFQLLVLCVLKSSVMKHHTDDALEFSFTNNSRPMLMLCKLHIHNTYKSSISETHLHHFTSDFRKLPNFPIVKHSNFIGLACNGRSIQLRSQFLQECHQPFTVDLPES